MWLDSGRNPHPVSVNVSRVDLFNLKFVEIIEGIVEKYNIPVRLLQLELTESAYMETPELMKKAMKSLTQYGFTILMDDFGSGYSSLSILKDIEVDILKIDMRFFSDSDSTGRGKSIVASVIRMAKWLCIPVVAEGVETKEQVQFLREVGCEYVQGYYYAKPMPLEEYDVYADGNNVFANKNENDSVRELNEIWKSDSNVISLMTSLNQAAALFEFENDNYEVLRSNDRFRDIFGCGEADKRLIQRPIECVCPEFRESVIQTFIKASQTDESVSTQYKRKNTDGSDRWVFLTLRYINDVGTKKLFYGCLMDITQQKQIEQELDLYRKKKLYNRIIVVDDLEINRVLLKTMFQNEFEVLEAQNGKEALRILSKINGEVDVILLDMIMPEMDGIEFLTKKKTDEKISDIPVVIITVDDSSKQQIDSLNLGAQDYIIKPFVEKVVVKRIHNVIDSCKRK